MFQGFPEAMLVSLLSDIQFKISWSAVAQEVEQDGGSISGFCSLTSSGKTLNSRCPLCAHRCGSQCVESGNYWKTKNKFYTVGSAVWMDVKVSLLVENIILCIYLPMHVRNHSKGLVRNQTDLPPLIFFSEIAIFFKCFAAFCPHFFSSRTCKCHSCLTDFFKLQWCFSFVFRLFNQHSMGGFESQLVAQREVDFLLPCQLVHLLTLQQKG